MSKTAQRPEDEWTVADVQVPEQIGGQRESVKTHSVVSVGKLCKASCDDRRGRICGERVESVRIHRAQKHRGSQCDPAESAALATALDRQLYLRLFWVVDLVWRTPRRY